MVSFVPLSAAPRLVKHNPPSPGLNDLAAVSGSLGKRSLLRCRLICLVVLILL